MSDRQVVVWVSISLELYGFHERLPRNLDVAKPTTLLFEAGLYIHCASVSTIIVVIAGLTVRLRCIMCEEDKLQDNSLHSVGRSHLPIVILRPLNPEDAAQVAFPRTIIILPLSIKHFVGADQK